ncbi:sodium/potassium/calcium exchanger 1-like isoform X4 [Poeciliopsis prolifica]|uniref:sodium/potassium/calcium exchanger 1-like isoform X4 n=1 Tax=Poeciliopsis prolifica TaxID=188132 RepID=UPI0024131536|nr:sodium/potassium/calcium exchanger 1-like isoform X4 [Poeciliopsis prolifica]
MQSPQRRRLKRSRVLFFVSGALLCCIYTLSLKTRQRPAPDRTDAGGGHGALEVRLREVRASNESLEITMPPLVVVVNRTDLEQCVYVDPRLARAPPTPPLTITAPPPRPPTQPPHSQGDYPEDIFSVEQRRQGWVVLHIMGMTYMFVALAIVCDEFFVPALEVIAAKLEISDDVAGATFMAAGGSAPELFTSLIGVFISHSNVGIGTIVGSAVFNILFVIGMCAVFSREMLHLTWWPLFRDVTFYILDLIMLIVFFLDNVIWWWESVMLVLGYMSYVTFMKFNSQIERTFKGQLSKHVSIVKVWSSAEPEKDSEAPPPPAAAPLPPPAADPQKTENKPKPEAAPGSPQHNNLQPEAQEDKDRLRVRPVLQRGGSSASLHNTSLRSTIFQLMIHTLDPLGEEAGHKQKSEQISSVGTPGGATAQPSTSQPPAEETPQKTSDKAEESKAAESAGETGGSQDGVQEDGSEEETSDSSESEEEEEDDENKEAEEQNEEESEPLSLMWPHTSRKRATYLFLLPIVFPLWLTLPDVRNLASKRFFIITFIGSIFWIGIFSYLMVWWAHQVGETIGISEEIMGLTILAAGTSIPDLITSVIVARKGLGDMAVSSSVGSNIFDITVGLPVPWLIYTAIYGKPVAVSSNGLFCAIVLLFLMLLFVIISIAACRWKMSKKLGFTMFVLYIVFLVLSVLLEDRILICPISI